MKYLLLPFAVLLVGCAAPRGPTVNAPLSTGWHEDKRVYYITTDITDPPMARGAQVNLATRMRDALPEYPKIPGTKDVLERVYKFPKTEQDAVFASIPRPLGETSMDEQYSPLWLLYTVIWANGTRVETLASEEAILAAEEQGKVTLTRTSIVINCPIVGTEREGMLRGWRFRP